LGGIVQRLAKSGEIREAARQGASVGRWHGASDNGGFKRGCLGHGVFGFLAGLVLIGRGAALRLRIARIIALSFGPRLWHEYGQWMTRAALIVAKSARLGP
jgi:hypothetical protein